LFRTALAFFALGGIAANIGLITNSIKWVRFGSRAHRNLSLNPKAYGRVIEAETIESLREPHWLWAANAGAMIAAVVGISFALYLLVALVRLGRAPDSGVRQLRRYRWWKRIAAVATFVMATWAGYANYYLEGGATRHISVGSWDPWVWPLMLFVGALIPCWWIGGGLDEAEDTA